MCPQVIDGNFRLGIGEGSCHRRPSPYPIAMPMHTGTGCYEQHLFCMKSVSAEQHSVASYTFNVHQEGQ